MSTGQYYDKKHENLDTPFKEPSIRLGLSGVDVLRCIPDKKALSIFKAVAFSENKNSRILKLINKQQEKEGSKALGG